jgi:hypothetical protein
MSIQWSDYITFCSSISRVIVSSGIFSPSSVDFVVFPDADSKWPTNPPPFCVIEIENWASEEEGVGGGRWSKTYGQEFKVHCIINNILDMSFRDTNLTTSYNPVIGAYTLIDNLINILEQSYPTSSSGRLVVVELPRSTLIEAPKRYQGSNQLSDICITFYIKFCERMDNTIVISATPN